MKILVVGDKESSYLWDHFDKIDRSRFGDIELILSTGDLKAEYLTFLVTMLNVPLLYVPGNHDAKYLQKPPEGCINIDGKVYRCKGLRILGLGGCRRYKPGPFQYSDRQMSWRVKKLIFKLFRTRGFDIMVCHAPALDLGDGKDPTHRGFTSFRHLLDKYRPRFFVHGHQHLTYNLRDRVTKHNDTTIINSEEYYIFEI